MSFTVFLGNLPTWVTADDIRSWLTAEGLVSDAIKVIRNPETQESKGFAFIEAPNGEEMQNIIRRFDRAPLEDRLLRANPAQPPKSKTMGGKGAPMPSAAGPAPAPAGQDRTTVVANRRGGKKGKRPTNAPQSAFAEELAKAL
jgi:RNA recognition motif-containing protein